MILGDRTGHPNDREFHNALRAARRLRPDLIISMGDLIDGYQPDEMMGEAEAEWDGVWKRIHAVLGEIPLYATAGNHDVWSDSSEALFEKKLNHPVNFAFDMASARIILLDTSRTATEAEIPEETLAWLWRELREAKHYKARIVVTHRPLWARSPGGKYGAPLHDIFIAGGVDQVLTAHWHHGMHDIRDEIDYQVIGPSGARPNRPGYPQSGNFQQIGLLIADDRGAELSVIRVDGVMAPEDLPYSANQLEHRIQNRAVVPLDFELDVRRNPTAGVFHLLVTNVTEERLSTTLRFTGESAWKISPRETAVSLDPGDEKRMRISYRRLPGDPLFPGPELEMVFPWPGAQTYRLVKAIDPVRFLRPGRTGGVLILDGSLDESLWTMAATVGSFGEVRNGPIPGATEVKVSVTQDKVYVGAILMEGDMAGQRRRVVARDEYVEDEDHFVVFIDADPESKGYARMAINASGSVQDREMGTGRPQEEEIAWNGMGEAVVHRFDDGWTVEAVISLPALGWNPETRRIGINFWRGRVRDFETAKAIWQPLLEHDNDSFGSLYLPK